MGAGSSEPSQVICEEGQQEAADVPVDDDGGEAQDTPGPRQHLGVWKTRWSQALPPTCLCSPAAKRHGASLPSGPVRHWLPVHNCDRPGVARQGRQLPRWAAGPRPFARAVTWGPEVGTLLRAPHRTGAPRAPAAPCLPPGAVPLRPLGVVEPPYSLFFLCLQTGPHCRPTTQARKLRHREARWLGAWAWQAAPTWRAAVDEERQPRGQAEAGQEGHGSWGERGHVGTWPPEPGRRAPQRAPWGPVNGKAGPSLTRNGEAPEAETEPWVGDRVGDVGGRYPCQ